MKEEFLRFGYEKASLNRISARVDITTAGLYKHFKNKNNMFCFLVNDTLSAFQKLNENNQIQMVTEAEYDPFSTDWGLFWVDFIFEHYEGTKLLVCCSKGSAYEDFEENLIKNEAEANKRYADILYSNGIMKKRVSNMQWHMLATAYVHLVFEIVKHDMSKPEAIEHMQFVSDLLFPGWKQLFGL